MYNNVDESHAGNSDANVVSLRAKHVEEREETLPFVVDLWHGKRKRGQKGSGKKLLSLTACVSSLPIPVVAYLLKIVKGLQNTGMPLGHQANCGKKLKDQNVGPVRASLVCGRSARVNGLRARQGYVRSMKTSGWEKFESRSGGDIPWW
jgi:hypothetical protein